MATRIARTTDPVPHRTANQEQREQADTRTAAGQADVDRAEAELMYALAESGRARAKIWRMLARLYRRELSQAEIDDLGRAFETGVPAVENAMMAQGYADLASYLRHRNDDARLDLAVDYASAILAAGSYEERRATPYESVFTSESGLLMQEARDDVYRLMCAAHLGVREGLREPEDHLGFECAFMADLAERQAAALDEGRAGDALAAVRMQHEMHAHHLLNWVDDYCDCLQSCAKTRFYQGVAKITRGFVHEEEAFIADSEDTLRELAGAGTDKTACA